MRALMAEIMGKEGALCGGRGGSQHLCDERFFSQGVQGGSMPIAAGYALGMRQRGDGGIVVAHIGDGTLGEGLVYESSNITSLLQLPLLVVLENNGVAQSTDTSTTTAGDLASRFSAFGLDVDRRDVQDPEALSTHFAEVVAQVRAGRPFVQILDTFRLAAHSKGDDDRSPERLQQAWTDDHLARSLNAGDPETVASWEAAKAEVQALVQEMESAGWAPLGELNAFVVPERPLFSSNEDLLVRAGQPESTRRVNELLNQSLHDAMERDRSLLLIGEDLLDPYGGAFKVSKGLSTRFPQRVLSTPISEAAIVGLGSGYALAGGKAVVEIMFGDFAALAADQIVNQAAKMHFMYAGKTSVPTTIRLVSGGYRGYGPTHSQSLEAFFCGIPGLKVVALSRRHHPGVLLGAATLRDPNPVIFVENKLLYGMRPHGTPPAGFRFVAGPAPGPGVYPTLAYSTRSEGEAADVTIVAYGGLTDIVEEAMEAGILDEELEIDYYVLSQLSPLYLSDVVASVQRTGRLLVVEEGPRAYGVGAEVVSQVASEMKGRPFRAARVGAVDVPIPNSRVQEAQVLPSKETILNTLLTLF